MVTAAASSSSPSSHYSSPEDDNNNDSNVNSLSLREAIDYCFDILKIKEDSSECYRNIIQTTITTTTKASLEITKTHGNWIAAMKLIADCSGIVNYNSNSNKKDNDDNHYHVFSQTQLYDFLTLASKVLENKEGRIDNNNNNIILKILRDIMENYENFNDNLKSSYPRIIVDVISILHKGIDTKGSKVSPVSIDKYYQRRKKQQQEEATMAEQGEITTTTPALLPASANAPTITTTTASTTVAGVMHKNKIPNPLPLPPLSSEAKKNLVESLSQITNRRRKELEQPLATLPNSDIKKLRELCHNYNRLQRYSKLITKGSEQEFRKEIEKELGRKLESYQLKRAADSVKRVRVYIENILDNKFIPDVSHGINHVKHNLEYGYQLMNLIDSRRQKTRY
jgi:hypothetical protein